MSEHSERTHILEQAKAAVTGQRQEDYGDIEDNFNTIARYWTTHLRAAHGEPVTLEGTDVAIMMSLLKLARLGSNPQHQDSWIDGAGYSACGGELAANQAKAQKELRLAQEVLGANLSTFKCSCCKPSEDR